MPDAKSVGGSAERPPPAYGQVEAEAGATIELHVVLGGLESEAAREVLDALERELEARREHHAGGDAVRQRGKAFTVEVRREEEGQSASGSGAG